MGCSQLASAYPTMNAIDCNRMPLWQARKTPAEMAPQFLLASRFFLVSLVISSRCANKKGTPRNGKAFLPVPPCARAERVSHDLRSNQGSTPPARRPTVPEALNPCCARQSNTRYPRRGSCPPTLQTSFLTIEISSCSKRSFHHSV